MNKNHGLEYTFHHYAGEKNKDIKNGKKVRVTIKEGGLMEVKRVHDNLFGKYGMMHWPYVERFTCVIGNKVGEHY